MSRFDCTFPLYLEKVLDALRVVAAALAADALHLLHLPGLARRLDVLEVDLGVLAEVHDGTQEVEQTCNTFTTTTHKLHVLSIDAKYQTENSPSFPGFSGAVYLLFQRLLQQK